MSPVQRVINIYKANSEFSNQHGSNSTLNMHSSGKKQDSGSGQSGYKNSFDKILSEKIKKYDARHS